jgi:uncharacterized protein YkwD
MDLSPGYSDTSNLQEPQLIDDRRLLVLNLINQVRSSFGANSVELDDSLDNLAQSYSQAEIAGNFFGHIDPQGRNPNQRALAVNISEGVGENLATDLNLTEAVLNLQRSPAHLKNMVNTQWTRVGLGIQQNNNLAYYLTQEFSSRDLALYPLTAAELNAIKQQIINYI